VYLLTADKAVASCHQWFLSCLLQAVGLMHLQVCSLWNKDGRRHWKILSWLEADVHGWVSVLS